MVLGIVKTNLTISWGNNCLKNEDGILATVHVFKFHLNF